MKKENTNLHWVITENLDDHIGYAGQPVTIIKREKDNYCTVQDKDGNQWYCGEEELKELPRLPLWKVLNEARTSGNISIMSTKNHFFLIQSDGLGGDDTLCTFHNNHDRQQTNAAYTALAVNNLHILAEALEDLISYVPSTWLNDNAPEGLKEICAKAKEALNRIS